MASGEGLAEAAAAWKLERLVSSEEHPMALDRERWERIQTVFHAVVDESPEVRDAHLERACGGDDELREAVLQLLHEDASSDSVMHRDVHFLAEQVLNVADAPADGVLRFGPYRVLRELGHGGMGVVFLAQRDDLGQLAAVKVLRDVWVSAAGYERLVGEQRTLAKLTHHSIARLYDADTLPDGTPWFAMEYVEGVSLTDYFAQNRALQDRLRLFREVCEAVRHAHQYLIVHRDLKPSNIMVTPNGSIKLLDFGIAKQLDSLDGVPDRTRTLLRMMTPNYAAPEELGAGAVGTHTDIYSLGVILYELLAGAALSHGRRPHPRRRSLPRRRTARSAPRFAGLSCRQVPATPLPQARRRGRHPHRLDVGGRLLHGASRCRESGSRGAGGEDRADPGVHAAALRRRRDRRSTLE